jgi:ABC-type oligopeptide transport system ATPase subunit
MTKLSLKSRLANRRAGLNDDGTSREDLGNNGTNNPSNNSGSIDTNSSGSNNERKLATSSSNTNTTGSGSTTSPNTAGLSWKEKLELRRKAAATSSINKSATSSAVASDLGKGDITFDMLNEKQKLAIKLGEEGDSFCLIGAAGYGKTTTVRLLTQQLSQHNKIGTLGEGEFTEKLLQSGGPRAAVLSYTNVAVRNIREVLPQKFASHCSTMHNLLEYHPEDFDEDEVDSDGIPTGETKSLQRFVPRYGMEPETDGGSGLGGMEKLPHLDLVIIEEAGSVPVYLFKTLISALPHPKDTTFIFLGDLNQLPPAFGDGILGYMLLSLPIVELNIAYRNVGIITKFAHRILEGRPIRKDELMEWSGRSDDTGSVKILPFAKKLEPEKAVRSYGRHFYNKVVSEDFNPDEDVVLIPYNKQFGTIELNRHIAQGFTDLHGHYVHHVVSGREEHYFSIGDRIMYAKNFYEIVDIEENKTYVGSKKARPASRLMDRWGRLRKIESEQQRQWAEEERESLQAHVLHNQVAESEAEIEALMEASADELREGSSKATHELYLRRVENRDSATGSSSPNGELYDIKINSNGQINEIIFTYALTVYKSQGSEWSNVYLVMHHTHGKQRNRETLYTGVTRARHNLVVMCSCENAVKSPKNATFVGGILSQVVPGATVKDKLHYFRDKLKLAEKSEEVRSIIDSHASVVATKEASAKAASTKPSQPTLFNSSNANGSNSYNTNPQTDTPF